MGEVGGDSGAAAAAAGTDADPLRIVDATLEAILAGHGLDDVVRRLLPQIARSWPGLTTTFGSVDEGIYQPRYRREGDHTEALTAIELDLDRSPELLTRLESGELVFAGVLSASDLGRVGTELTSRGRQTAALVPVRHRTRLVALLTVDGPTPRVWSAAERATLTRVGHCLELAVRDTEYQRDAFEQQRLLLGFLEALPVGVMVCAPDGQIQFVNEAARALRIGLVEGPLQETLEPLAVHYLDAPEPVPLESLPIARALAGETVRGVRMEVRRPEGRIPFEVHTEPIQNADGEPAAAIAVFWDISDTLEADRRKDEFVSMVSHELRTPLTSLFAALRMLAATSSGLPAPQGQLLELAHRNATRLIGLVDDILDLQSIRAGHLRLEPTELELHEVCGDVLEALTPLAQDAGVLLQLDGAPGVRARADRARLVQVVSHAVSNAIKFGGRESTVRIEVGSRDSRPVIEVRDQGPGIPADQIERLFDPFVQGDSSDTRAAGGTGLGLSIARTLVERMGGSIELTSELGTGTTVRIALTPVDG